MGLQCSYNAGGPASSNKAPATTTCGRRRARRPAPPAPRRRANPSRGGGTGRGRVGTAPAGGPAGQCARDGIGGGGRPAGPARRCCSGRALGGAGVTRGRPAGPAAAAPNRARRVSYVSREPPAPHCVPTAAASLRPPQPPYSIEGPAPCARAGAPPGAPGLLGGWAGRARMRGPAARAAAAEPPRSMHARAHAEPATQTGGRGPAPALGRRLTA
jgi:hypothetical protein